MSIEQVAMREHEARHRLRHATPQSRQRHSTAPAGATFSVRLEQWPKGAWLKGLVRESMLARHDSHEEIHLFHSGARVPLGVSLLTPASDLLDQSILDLPLQGSRRGRATVFEPPATCHPGFWQA